jgi:hypothetical protein
MYVTETLRGLSNMVGESGNNKVGLSHATFYPHDTMSYVDNAIRGGDFVENFSLENLILSKCQSLFRVGSIPLTGFESPTFPHLVYCPI